MDSANVFSLSDAVEYLLECAPQVDEMDAKKRVASIVSAVVRQMSCEQVAPAAVNKRLTRIGKEARQLENLMYDDNPECRSARKSLTEAVGSKEFEELHGLLVKLALGGGLDDTEFAPALEAAAADYNRRVSDAAREVSALLSEGSRFGRALRRQIRGSAIERLKRRLQNLGTAATSINVPMEVRPSPLFAPAQAARYFTKISSGGRPIETAKLTAVWGSYHLLVELGLPLTEDSDGVLCRLSALCYEAATGEPDADLSHAVKIFLDDLRSRGVID